MSTAGLILIENIKTEYHNLTFTPAQKILKLSKQNLEMMLVSLVRWTNKTYIIEKDGVK